MKLIDKDALVAEIENLENTYKKCPTRNSYEEGLKDGRLIGYKDALHKINTLEVKEVDISNISENLAEAYEYLDYTSTGNLAHNKPMVSARLKKAIRGLFDAGLFELTHDKKYRMEKLCLKAQKGE